ncbi:methionyl-tRNA formyltransferase [Actinomycetaceae bacterium MB13-C1-2]|nr:methionyl-tRNA formyltransferase [Actinomycetaceae bacterium MB13-C1-2]
MRIVFAGTPKVALPTLLALIHSEHEVVGVITRPPAAQGRSRKLVDSPVGAFAKQEGLNLRETSRPGSEEDLRWLTDLRADAGVVVAYGALLTPAVLDSTRLGWVNLHFSSLPDLRGAAPVQRAILRGDTTIGTTVFLLDPGMDSGPIIETQKHRTTACASSGEVLEELSEIGSTQVVSALTKLQTSGYVPTPQDTGPDDSFVTLAPKLSRQDGFISFEESAENTVNRIRAVTPAPGAWTLDATRKPMKLRGATLSDQTLLAPGQTMVVGQLLKVGTSDTDIVLSEVAPAGKSWMRGADWARGARMTEDDRLGGVGRV